ncbi:MAG: YraN family protein [Alphaproteobacteria bacterium]|nr:YraN family protein [Alphaproteobacteria bacterium]
MIKPALHKQKYYAWKKGKKAEFLARWYLRICGYKILDYNIKTSLGEIDIIARKKSCIFIIEVKARKDLDKGLEAIQHYQQKRIHKATLLWLQKTPQFGDYSVRFVALLIIPLRLPKLILDAWFIE